VNYPIRTSTNLIGTAVKSCTVITLLIFLTLLGCENPVIQVTNKIPALFHGEFTAVDSEMALPSAIIIKADVITKAHYQGEWLFTSYNVDSVEVLENGTIYVTFNHAPDNHYEGWGYIGGGQMGGLQEDDFIKTVIDNYTTRYTIIPIGDSEIEIHYSFFLADGQVVEGHDDNEMGRFEDDGSRRFDL